MRPMQIEHAVGHFLRLAEAAERGFVEHRLALARLPQAVRPMGIGMMVRQMALLDILLRQFQRS